MSTKSQFFFGGTSRPVMISLHPKFTYFDAEFSDCTGLQLSTDDHDQWSGLFLRTPNEIHGLTLWLRCLAVPTLAPGEFTEVLSFEPNFSPQYANESIKPDGDFDGYDATALDLRAVWRNDLGKGYCLHLSPNDEDGLAVRGVPLELLPQFCEALETFALEWAARGINLKKSQPLAHIPAP